MQKSLLPIPAQKALRKLGHDIGDARRRRRITVKLLAERADISARTLNKIEKGEASVAIGYYASVLFALGMVNQVQNLADVSHDAIGRELDDERLPKRVRLPRKNKNGVDDE